MNGGVGSTGVPTDRSTMPSGCARARSAAGARRSQGKSGSRPELMGSFSVLVDEASVDVRRECSDDRVVLVDLADLGRPTGRAEVVEELDVGLVVVLPLLGRVVLVEDRL